MAIDLMALEPQRISKSLKGKFIMLYGLPGVGKTSLAAQFPKSIIIGFEMGTNGLDDVYVQPTKTWNEWKQIVSQLLKKPELKEKFETICIDTTDSAWDLCVKYICSQNGVEKLGDIPWGQGYDQAKKEFASGFRDLSYAGYGLVFISHSTEKTFKDEKGEEYTQIAPALPNRPYDIINKMVDIIGYIREIETENGERKRFVFFRGDDRFFAKSRFQYIEPKVEFSYHNIVEAIQAACDKQASLSGQSASEEVNPYITLNFDELMEQAKELFAKATETGKVEEISKVLENVFGKPIRFSEILPEQVEQLNQVLIEIKSTVL